MRWVQSSLMVLALTSPALSTAQDYSHLIFRGFPRPYPNAPAGPASFLRLLLVALGLVGGLLSPAFAGDYDLPVLRGSNMPPPATFPIVQPSTYHWGGVYGGIQGGYASSTNNFGTSATPQILSILNNAPGLPDPVGVANNLGNSLGNLGGSSASASSAGVGGFIGYNWEWDNAVITGLELNYNHSWLSTSAGNSTSISFKDSANIPAGHHYFFSPANASVQSSVNVTDIATFRLRAGWEAGNFLPYAFAAFAVGRAESSNTTTVSYAATDVPDVQTPPTPPLGFLTPLNFGPVTQGAQNVVYPTGFAMGFGMDVALTSNVFVRGEVEYIYFAPINGVQISVTSARVGAGLKF